MPEFKYSKIVKKMVLNLHNEKFGGYDPYDGAISDNYSKWQGVSLMQFHKVSPINFRKVFGIKKSRNTKGVALLLESFSELYMTTGSKYFGVISHFLFSILKDSTSKNTKNPSWGYNLNWYTPGSVLKKNHPSVVVTSFVHKGIYTYYKAFESAEAKVLLEKTEKYITDEVERYVPSDDEICFKYSAQHRDLCHNANLLAAEILIRCYELNKNEKLLAIIERCFNFTLNRQERDGSWAYSFNQETGNKRMQIDFHQGYILDSIYNLTNTIENMPKKYNLSFNKGLEFYYNKQFLDTGICQRRYPRLWPVDIHNQAQGVISFSRFSAIDKKYGQFAHTILDWTIRNMFDNRGFFYYQFNPLYSNKINYMRWSQAWMLLAIINLKNSGCEKE